MITDTINSFTDNIKEKFSNPFLGTYLLVWLVRNWLLVYTLFNFDKDCDLNYKITFIKTYYSHNNFLGNLAINILWAFALMVATYILINIARAIVNLFEKKLTPWIYEKTDSSSIVLKTTYEDLRKERSDLLERLEQERESKAKLEIRIKNLEHENFNIHDEKGVEIRKNLDLNEKLKAELEQKANLELTNTNSSKLIAELSHKNTQSEIDLKNIEDEVSKLNNQINDSFKERVRLKESLDKEISFRKEIENQIYSNETKLAKSSDNIKNFMNDEALDAFYTLQAENKLQDYYSLYLRLNNDAGKLWIRDLPKHIDYYSKLGLVADVKQLSDSIYNHYAITLSGQAIGKYLTTLGYNF